MTHSELRTILLAEDDPHVRELSAMVLETIGGFTVIQCRNGEQAVAEARRLGPDLIVLDWMMPRLNGSQTIAALRNDPRTQDIPVVFMTARSRIEEIARMTELGAAGIVQKPFDPAKLSHQIRRIWTEKRGITRPS